jgi:hypothetical protein
MSHARHELLDQPNQVLPAVTVMTIDPSDQDPTAIAMNVAMPQQENPASVLLASIDQIVRSQTPPELLLDLLPNAVGTTWSRLKKYSSKWMPMTKTIS